MSNKNLIDLAKSNPFDTPFSSPANADQTKKMIAERNIAFAAAAGASKSTNSSKLT